jgi:hypothetical protein
MDVGPRQLCDGSAPKIRLGESEKGPPTRAVRFGGSYLVPAMASPCRRRDVFQYSSNFCNASGLRCALTSNIYWPRSAGSRTRHFRFEVLSE